MSDNTLNKSKENIDKENNSHLNNNNNKSNNSQWSNNNRFQGNINIKSNLPTNSGNVLFEANRFGNNITTDPNQHLRNSHNPFVINRFQDSRINKSAFFPNGNAIPTNFNRSNFAPNNINNFHPNINQHYLNQNPNNFYRQPNFNINNLNPNNFNPYPNFYLNQNPNNFNGQPNINQHYLNQHLNNFNNFQPNPNLNQNINGQQNFNPNLNNFNNFHPNPNLNQNPNNFNGQPNINPIQNNVNGQPNINPNNLDQNISNINDEPNINALDSNDTPIVENDTTSPISDKTQIADKTQISDATSEKDKTLDNSSATNSDTSLNKEPLETDKVKSTYNPRSKKRLTFITLSSMFGTGALVAAIAVPIALISPNIQNITQPIIARIAYDLETKNVKLVVESDKLPHDVSSYSVFRETLNKIFEPIIQQNIKLVPIGNSEINLDFTDANLTVDSIYKVIINDGSPNGIEVVSSPSQNINMPKISITSQSQSQILLASTSPVTTTLSVDANVTTNPIPNQEISYQWKSSNTNSINEADWTPIANETKPTYTYDSTDLSIGVKKYFKCIVSYKYADPVTSTAIYIEKVNNKPVISITTHPEITKTLTSDSTNFSLVANASVTNQISGQQVSYQWQSSSSENGTYANIDGATSATYNHQLDVNTKNSWRDTWYKCVVSYPGATPVSTVNALVKMTLTEAEAKVELLKWLAVEANAISILTRHFNEPIETSVKNTFYKSLHEHRIVGGNPTLVVHSIEPMQITANNNYPTSYKSYKIKLKTTSPANVAPKETSATTRTVFQAGMIIEFNTLFSFGGETVELYNTTSNSKYNMTLTPTFTTYNNKPTTTLLWTSDTSNGGVDPTAENPYKKGAYPVRFYENAISTNPIIDDSVFLPSRLQAVYTGGAKNYLYPMIPTYHIRTIN